MILHLPRLFFCLLAASFFLCAFSVPHSQAAGPAAGKPATAVTVQNAQLKALIKTLKNDDERKELIDNLELMLKAQEKQPKRKSAGVAATAFENISKNFNRIGAEFTAFSNALLNLPETFENWKNRLSDKSKRDQFFGIVWRLLLVLGLGLLAEWLLRVLLRRPRAILETRPVESFWAKAPTLLGRTVIDMLPIGAFFFAGYAVLSGTDATPRTQELGATLIYANVAARLCLAVARMLLAPRAENLRLLPITDIDAHYSFLWVRRLVSVSVYGYLVVELLRISGLSAPASVALLKLLGLFVTLMVTVLILQNRAVIASRIAGASSEDTVFGVLRSRIAAVWHVLALLYLSALYLVWALDIEDGSDYLIRATVISALIIIAAMIITNAFKRAFRRVFALREDVKARFPSLETRANLYVPIIERTGSVIFTIIGAVFVLQAWGVDMFALLTSPPSKRIIGSILTIAILIVITVIVWELISAVVERRLNRDGDVSARAKTLLPLLRLVTLIVLITMVVMVTLSELGLNIGPLLAGAGVVGLAVGFGAQTLVKDIITGIFILTEDQIAVGDVIKLGTHAGKVEHLTLRTLRLRDVAGIVHIIPFSDVTTVENMTKDFSRYVFNVGVAYREDTDSVVEVLCDIGEEMQADEEYKDLILEPLEVMGVDSFGDNSVNIKARITTKPIYQWKVGREFNRRMKIRFDELGIEIPFPHRTLYFGVDKQGSAPPGRIALINAEDEPEAPEKPSRPDANTSRTTATPTPRSGGGSRHDGDAGGE